VTNHHVMTGVSSAFAVFSDGSSSTVTDVFADSQSKDLIVLVVDTGHRPALRLGDELTLRQGDAVYAIGAPQGLELTLTNGIVSAFRNIGNRFLIQSTAAIGHGSSGGPLLDSDGLVVGITSSMLSGTPGVYFSSGAGDLKRLLRTPEALLIPLAEWGRQNSDAGASAPTNQPEATAAQEADRVEALISEKKYDQARAAINSLSATDPGSETVHRLLGELDDRIGNLDEALRELSQAVQQQPTDPIAQFDYAMCLFEARQFPEALQHEQKSNELEPTNGDKPLLAILYYSVRDYRHAEAFARDALNWKPNDRFALAVMAGVAYHGASSQGTWRQYAEQLSTEEPDGFWTHMLKGVDAYNQRQTNEAIAEFKAAEEYSFPDPAPYLILASWYQNASELGSAEDQIEAGLASLPDDPQLLNQGVYRAPHPRRHRGRSQVRCFA
jgi:tetratricopeptide (TPR) repeat protein